MLKKTILLTLSFLVFSSFAAETFAEQHVVVAPLCLLKNLKGSYKTLSTSQPFVLIEVNDKGIEKLVQAKKENRANACGGFMDVTQHWNEVTKAHLSTPKSAKTFLIKYTTSFPQTKIKKEYKIRYESQVNQLLKQINPQTMWTNLTTLSSFPDRYSRGDNGVKAAEWLKTQIQTIAKDTGHDDVTVYTVATGNYKQPSVVAKIGSSQEPGIVIGGHMDTLSSDWEKKPGAKL